MWGTGWTSPQVSWETDLFDDLHVHFSCWTTAVCENRRIHWQLTGFSLFTGTEKIALTQFCWAMATVLFMTQRWWVVKRGHFSFLFDALLAISQRLWREFCIVNTVTCCLVHFCGAGLDKRSLPQTSGVSFQCCKVCLGCYSNHVFIIILHRCCSEAFSFLHNWQVCCLRTKGGRRNSSVSTLSDACLGAMGLHRIWIALTL